ncbi:GGDEF domain-containing protein [Allosaccharopolyspora coralli]|uniref:GGDEF domain-containing protein n=1 Tax=Allosaccharopolyspora coralli TaxID=2665642 RepID=UPI001E29D40F|nr:GGDEF domain-containing protein [Allosaccharopolyspora coralli]
MTGTPLEGDFESVFDEIRTLGRNGDEEGAIAAATALAERAPNSKVSGRALMLKLGWLHNLGRIDQFPPVLDHAFEILGGLDEYALLGGVHALAAPFALHSSMERCLRHLVQAARYLELVDKPEREAVDAWHNLAVSYSFAGFHGQAMEAAERGYLLGRALGMQTFDHALPEVAVRCAVSLDHRGDQDGCVRMLREVLRTWSRRTNPAELWCAERLYYAYASARLALLGEDVTVERELLATEAPGFELDDLRLLGRASVAIVDGDPAGALARLAGRRVHSYTLGAAEIHRVRALAHQARGELGEALAVNRQTVRLATEVTDTLRDRLVDGTRAQLDHEALRRMVDRYASEALTDPLTGLPNRRHFHRRVTADVDDIRGAALGIIDLDDFKTVNTVHGHSGGDLVLQRLAAVVGRAVRRGDFVARYGGDEFVVVLPDTDLATAQATGERIAAAVLDEDWEALVPGTPVSATVGWAKLSGADDVEEALTTADREMLAKKTIAVATRERR